MPRPHAGLLIRTAPPWEVSDDEEAGRPKARTWEDVADPELRERLRLQREAEDAIRRRLDAVRRPALGGAQRQGGCRRTRPASREDA